MKTLFYCIALCVPTALTHSLHLYTDLQKYKHNPLIIGLHHAGYAKHVASDGTFSYKAYFDTKKIGDTETAQKMLAQEGVLPLEHKVATKDGAQLETYARRLEHPDYTFILPAGFSPGKLFGMTTFCKLLPKNSNLFFFHARDRGNSTSPNWLRNDVWRYGRDHWKDIEAMIQHAHQQAPETPIYIMSICAGAFHALHAAHQMGEELTQYNVKGIIADSTMTSNWEMAKTAIPMELTKRCNCIIGGVSRFGLHTIRYSIYKPLTWILGLEQDTQITPKVTQNIAVPICYIHGINDPYAKIDNIHTLARKNDKNDKTCEKDEINEFSSEPGKSIHAIIHLKHPDEYKKTINQFIENNKKDE